MPDFALAVPFPGLVAARVEPLLPLRSRVETVLLYEHVDADRWRELHTSRL
jgi:hypothetical protein